MKTQNEPAVRRTALRQAKFTRKGLRNPPTTIAFDHARLLEDFFSGKY
jgi:hypothetical protein